jgi:hypothetical protein
LKQFDVSNLLKAIKAPHDDEVEGFNEKILRVLCLNTAIEKIQKQTSVLF